MLRHQPPSPSRSIFSSSSVNDDPFRTGSDPECEKSRFPQHLQWVSLGISFIFLAHFASMYTQLPGLYGQTGLLPIADRVHHLKDIWALQLFPTPELGMEAFAGLGMLVAATQIVFRQLRQGPLSVLLYGLQWLFWHDLVMAGGRFTSYQMDLLLLDAAPLTLLAASGLAPEAATFGFRWLLSRLYLGAGAVKLLSCDSSWRDLSAIHWHFQSQPLPNSIAAAAYLHLPLAIGQALTLFVLVWEMAAPYVFLAPSFRIRQIAFLLNLALMVGIALFGNFGSLQALLIVISFALLDVPKTSTTRQDAVNNSKELTDESTTALQVISQRSSLLVLVVALALAAGAGFWAVHTVGANCVDTWAISPLVYDLLLLGLAVALLPLLEGRAGTALGSLVILAGSAASVANGLGVSFPRFFEFLNFGAIPYGLFATMTGTDGARPVATIEAALSMEGPWHYVPFWYQVNDPSGTFPFCFPHFPRLDWTVWFIPLGESGAWIGRFLYGIMDNDPAVLGLVNEKALRDSFPDAPPAIVRIVPSRYTLMDSEEGWVVSNEGNNNQALQLTFTKKELETMASRPSPSTPWPSTPIVRSIASSSWRPEYFSWGCIGSAELCRRVLEWNDAQNQRDIKLADD